MQNRRCVKWDCIGKTPHAKACGYLHVTPPQAKACGYSYAKAVAFIFIFFFLQSLPAHAETQWSVSAVTGYYLPRLDELNYILRHQDVELGPRNMDAKPSSYPVIYQGVSPDDMPDMRMKAPKAGIELQADINPSLGIIFGQSISVFESTKRDVRPFFVGFSIPSDRVTRFSLVLNQFWLGIKRNWTFGDKGEKTKKPETGSQKPDMGKLQEKKDKPSARLYTKVGILAVTRAYLTTDVWLHVYAPEEGFDFYKVTETESHGNGYATFMGAGGEYFINNYLSVGIDIDYTVGAVSRMKFSKYFTVDPLEKDIIKIGEKVEYADFIQGKFSPLYIGLEGWDIKGQVRYYF